VRLQRAILRLEVISRSSGSLVSEDPKANSRGCQVGGKRVMDLRGVLESEAGGATEKEGMWVFLFQGNGTEE